MSFNTIQICYLCDVVAHIFFSKIVLLSILAQHYLIQFSELLLNTVVSLFLLVLTEVGECSMSVWYSTVHAMFAVAQLVRITLEQLKSFHWLV